MLVLPTRPKGGGSCGDEATYLDFYKNLYADLSVDREENQELFDFFAENVPSDDFLVGARAVSFKAACEFLSDDKSENIKLLKCINVVVHAFESTCLT